MAGSPDAAPRGTNVLKRAFIGALKDLKGPAKSRKDAAKAALVAIRAAVAEFDFGTDEKPARGRKSAARKASTTRRALPRKATRKSARRRSSVQESDALAAI